jgi:uncharacterized LabA/DUF88 family protein
MNFYDHERAALFIDGEDLDATCGVLGFDIDFKRLLDLFRARTRLVRAAYYVLCSEASDREPLRSLVDWLSYNGYVTVTKALRVGSEGARRRGQPGSIAVELTIDALQLAPSLDHLILMSGSANFRALLAALQKSGRRVTVVSSREAGDMSVADELRRQCDQFVDLVDLEPIIGLESARPADEKRASAPRRGRSEKEAAR